MSEGKSIEKAVVLVGTGRPKQTFDVTPIGKGLRFTPRPDIEIPSAPRVGVEMHTGASTETTLTKMTKAERQEYYLFSEVDTAKLSSEELNAFENRRDLVKHFLQTHETLGFSGEKLKLQPDGRIDLRQRYKSEAVPFIVVTDAKTQDDVYNKMQTISKEFPNLDVSVETNYHEGYVEYSLLKKAIDRAKS